MPEPQLSTEAKGYLVHTSPLNKYVQAIVTVGMRVRIMYFSHNNVHVTTQTRPECIGLSAVRMTGPNYRRRSGLCC